MRSLLSNFVPGLGGPPTGRRDPNRPRRRSADDSRSACVTLLTVINEWLRRHRKLLAWTAGSLALLLLGIAVTGYVMFRHFNDNIDQANISPLLGKRPADLHPQAENIVVIGSDTRVGAGMDGRFGAGLTTDQSDTLMVIHIPADRKWAEVMSIPRDSYVNIPSCTMGDGKLSAPTQFKINEAFALGNLDGNHTALGAACTIKTIEQDTGIYVNHFIVVNFTGFENMVAALGGVEECSPVPLDAPGSGLDLSAGYHLLNPTEALAYVRAREGLGDGSDLAADRPAAGVHDLPDQPGEERAVQPAGDLPVPRRGHPVAHHRQPARRAHRPVQPAAVAPLASRRARSRFSRCRTSRGPTWCRPTPRTCCGRSRRTARSSPRSATTSPPARRSSSRPRRPSAPASPASRRARPQSTSPPAPPARASASADRTAGPTFTTNLHQAGKRFRNVGVTA